MKVTIRQLSTAAQSGALAALNAKELPIRTTLRMKKVANEAESQLNDANECLRELFNRYADGDSVPEDQREAYLTEVDELMGAEVELSEGPFTVDELGDIALATEHMMALDWLIEA